MGIGAAIAGAAVAAAGSAAAGAMNKPGKVKQTGQQWADPLGPSGFSRRRGTPQFNRVTGAIPMRDWVFDDLNTIGDTARRGMPSANAAQRFANQPGFEFARNNATAAARGDFLHGSPELNFTLAKMRAASGAEGANNAANLRSQFSRNGMGFSTSNQMAQHGAQTSATAQADATEAQARLQNYLAERQVQLDAPNALAKASSVPLDYLRYSDAAQMGQLSQISQIIAGLAGGGQVTGGDTVVSPGNNMGAAAMAAATPMLSQGVMNSMQRPRAD
jgi:hypothetical protein